MLRNVRRNGTRSGFDYGDDSVLDRSVLDVHRGKFPRSRAGATRPASDHPSLVLCGRLSCSPYHRGQARGITPYSIWRWPHSAIATAVRRTPMTVSFLDSRRQVMKRRTYLLAMTAVLAWTAPIGFTPAQATVTATGSQVYARPFLNYVHCRRVYHYSWSMRRGKRVLRYHVCP